MTRIVSLLIALALAAPVAAQTAGGSTETPSTQQKPAAEAQAEKPAEQQADQPAQAPAAGTDTGLTMGTDSDSVADVGQPYTKEESGDWQLQCVKVAEGEDPCQLYQLVKDDKGNPVAEFSLFRLPEGGKAVAGATIVVPLETALIEDLLLSVDGGKGKRYRYSFCNQVGCFARIGLTQADIDSLKKGKAANLQITPYAAPDVKLKLNLSLIGFTAGYDKVTVAPGANGGAGNPNANK